MNQPFYVYTYACHEDEEPLCSLELRTLFGTVARSGYIESSIPHDVSRSPFVKQRLDVLFQGRTVQELAEHARQLQLNGATFKIQYVAGGRKASIPYEEERVIERLIGAQVRGMAEMRTPAQRFGVMQTEEGRWVLGRCADNEAVWLRHKDKPQQYSTALTTRMARAVANIAVPFPRGMRAIDPCCGIGTVILEALSMEINMVGCDVNPLAVKGARHNLAHFGFPDVITLGDMREMGGEYDAAVVDLPYNLCSVLSETEQLSMLESVRRLAKRAVILSTNPIEKLLAQSGLRITDQCAVRKGSLIRRVFVCQ